MLAIVFDNGQIIRTKANWFKEGVLMRTEKGKEDAFVAVIPNSTNAVVVKADEMLNPKFNIIDAVKLIEEHQDIPKSILKTLETILNKKKGAKGE